VPQPTNNTFLCRSMICFSSVMGLGLQRSWDALSQGIGAQTFHRSRRFLSRARRRSAHGGGQIDHAQALAAHADLVEHVAQVLAALLGAQVSFQKVTTAFQAAGQSARRRHPFRSRQNVLHFDLARCKARASRARSAGTACDANPPSRRRRRRSNYNRRPEFPASTGRRRRSSAPVA